MIHINIDVILSKNKVGLLLFEYKYKSVTSIIVIYITSINIA